MKVNIARPLPRSLVYTRQILKTPIVVNDSLGFFTSRTFGTYLDEGVRLLKEGVHPVQIDNLGKAVGMPVGPLAVHDEVSLELTRKAGETHAELGVARGDYDLRPIPVKVKTIGPGGTGHQLRIPHDLEPRTGAHRQAPNTAAYEVYVLTVR